MINGVQIDDLPTTMPHHITSIIIIYSCEALGPVQIYKLKKIQIYMLEIFDNSLDIMSFFTPSGFDLSLIHI